MNSFDRAILLFLNSFAGRSWTIDNLTCLMARNMLLKGAIFVFLFWWLWFRRKPDQAKDREFLLLGAIAPLFAVLIARIVAHALPFRERPLREAGLNFHLPYGMNSEALEGWSSFPSDHAAFFFALAVVFFLVCRRTGILAFAYSILVVCLPRAYLGIHHPTDLVAGAAIGTSVACLTLVAPMRQAVTRPVLRYFDHNPSLSYGCLSILTYVIGTVCEPAPELIRFVPKAIAACLARTGHPLHFHLGKQSVLESLAVVVAAVGTIAMLALLCRRFLVLMGKEPEMIGSNMGKRQQHQSLAASNERRGVSSARSGFSWIPAAMLLLVLFLIALLGWTVFAHIIPAKVATVVPSPNYVGANPNSVITATFSKAMDGNTVTSSTFQLRDSSNNVINAKVSYRDSTRVATLQPASPLRNNTIYTATIVGGSAGVRDGSGNVIASNSSWSFSTAGPAAPPPSQGFGGPILVITTGSRPVDTYLAEILRAEGLNLFATLDISRLSAKVLADYQVIILGETALTAGQVNMFSKWVKSGGTLIAMRPDKRLAGLLGLGDASGTLSDAYLAVDTDDAPGAGIVGETIQFHGTADLYTLGRATAIATLYSDATHATRYPAVTQNKYGDGVAAAFSYDLAESVVHTRQGNPAWAGQARSGLRRHNGQPGAIRSHDLFYGPASFDPKPNYVDLAKVAIPQADEQQRLLANMILLLNRKQMPLPRFWYFPNSLKAALVMTGDDHGAAEGGGATAAHFDQYLAYSPTGCSVPDWQCVRATSYLLPPDVTTNTLTDEQVAAYTAQGFEISLHLDTGCRDWTTSVLASAYAREISSLTKIYPSMPAPRTHRTHCVSWTDYDSQPKTELTHGIRLDTTYYYFPPAWVNDSPGMFTGSGMPMRFADRNGNLLDIYQATTQMTDESGQSYPKTVNALLDNALGANGYYGFFVANVHNDQGDAPALAAVISSAQAHGVPIISAAQLLRFVDGRNGSFFNSLAWNSSRLTFTISVGADANGLQAMLPINSSAGVLRKITRNGSPISYSSQKIKGIQYAIFTAIPGSYVASY